MNLPKLPHLGSKDKTEYYLSLVLRDEKASAVVFEETGGRINVVGEHTQNFKTSIEDATGEELLDAIDKAVSTAERSLPPDVESHKTIFGVKQEWTTDGKISQDYLLKLKKVSDELDFKPVGFLVISEAIAHLLEKEEGAPISAVLVEIGARNVTLSLIKAGKVIETKSGALEESAIQTVDKLLHHFRVSEVLPARIILFDGGKEELQQEFITHTWSKALPFLHVPQVSTLPANFDARAVLNGAASQMGLAVSEVSLSQAVKEDKTIPVDALAAATAIGDETEDGSVKKTPVEGSKEAGIPEEDKTIGEVVQDFGFSGADVKKKGKKGTLEGAENLAKVAVGAAAVGTTAEAVGVGATESAKPNIEPKTAVGDNFTQMNPKAAAISQIPDEEKLEVADKKPLSENAAAITAGMTGAFKRINLRGMLSNANSSRKKLLIIGVPIAVILLLFFVYIFLRSATVTLDIQNKTESKTEDATFSASSATDPDKNIIAAQFLTVSEDGKVSTTTTGKKQTGDEAKGTVTVFNNSDSGATLPTGTKVTSSNNLTFTTDKPVTVASASGDIFSGTKPGTGTVTVTAEKFGTNYNLPSGTKFSVSGTSDIAAKNDNAFSGGTTKNIQVVSKDDLAKLQTTLGKQLGDSAKSDIAKKATGGSSVLPDFISESFTHKSFSHQEGDQANEVALTGTISYDGISYQNTDMQKYVAAKLDGGDDKLKVNNDQIAVSANDLKQKGNDATAKLTIKAGLIPNIDEQTIKNQIKGKSVDQATNMLNSIPQMEHASVSIFPPIPLLPSLVPFSSGKIKIIINTNG